MNRPYFYVEGNHAARSVRVSFNEGLFVRPSIFMLMFRQHGENVLRSFERHPLTERMLAAIEGEVSAKLDMMIAQRLLYERWDGLWDVVTPREQSEQLH